MDVYKSKKGYCYKEYKNGKKKRISINEYKKIKQKGAMAGGDPTIEKIKPFLKKLNQGKYKNGKKKRISINEYKKIKQKGAMAGGDPTIEKIKPFLKKLNHGEYEIFVRKLEKTHTDKICHHYSFFSLYEEEDCCDLNSKALKQILQPQCEKLPNGPEYCDYDISCNTGDCTYEKNDIETQKYKVSLYNNDYCDNEYDTYFFDHSSREESGLIWHKFNGNDFLFAINSADNNIKHLELCIFKTIELETVPVPSEFFLNNQDIITICHYTIL